MPPRAFNGSNSDCMEKRGARTASLWCTCVFSSPWDSGRTNVKTATQVAPGLRVMAVGLRSRSDDT